MSHDAPWVPLCPDCGQVVFTRPKGCSNSDCRHSMTFQLDALRLAAQALVNKIESLRPWPLWMQMAKDDFAALEATLKAVGS